MYLGCQVGLQAWRHCGGKCIWVVRWDYKLGVIAGVNDSGW